MYYLLFFSQSMIQCSYWISLRFSLFANIGEAVDCRNIKFRECYCELVEIKDRKWLECMQCEHNFKDSSQAWCCLYPYFDIEKQLGMIWCRLCEVWLSKAPRCILIESFEDINQYMGRRSLCFYQPFYFMLFYFCHKAWL